jgi:Holliday junction resolvase RusA-like endonuclease
MKILIDYKLDNWNDTVNINRTNRYAAASKKKKEMEIIKMFLIGKPKITKYPIELNCTWYVKNLASDLDNKSLKAVLDAMQEVGILENDNIKHIPIINHKAIKSDKDYLEIEIKEMK